MSLYFNLMPLTKLENSQTGSVGLQTEGVRDWTEVDVLKIQDHHKFTFWGQSVSGTRTCIVIDELKVIFDMGFFPRKAARYGTVLLTHGHADHMGSLHFHAFDRSLNRLFEPIYVMPIYCVDYFNQAYQALKHLNRHCDGELATRYKIIGTDPQETGGIDVMMLSSNYKVRSYQMIHAVPAVGYVIFEIRKHLRMDLKTKLDVGEITGQDIAILAKSGEIVNEINEKPIIGFSGDTTIEGLLRHPDLLNSETLIVECTYLDAGLDSAKNDSPEECKRRGHIHEQHIIAFADQFKCQELMLCHFSRKYKRTHIYEARDRLQAVFGDRLLISLFLD